MWYVMQVRTGTEENICCQCQRLIGNDILEDCFIPYYQQQKRFQGKWHIQERILFPGYVFLIVKNLESLIENLNKIMGVTKLLRIGDEIISLSDNDIALLNKLLGSEEEPNKRVIAISKGIIQEEQIQILAGPLQGLEDSIMKIDRHKRMAYLNVSMFGEAAVMKVGLEIIKKISE